MLIKKPVTREKQKILSLDKLRIDIYNKKLCQYDRAFLMLNKTDYLTGLNGFGPAFTISDGMFGYFEVKLSLNI